MRKILRLSMLLFAISLLLTVFFASFVSITMSAAPYNAGGGTDSGIDSILRHPYSRPVTHTGSSGSTTNASEALKVKDLNPPSQGGGSPPVSAQGKVIVVSISHQALIAYDNGQQVFTTLVTTGMPQLYTPTGTFHIFNKVTNVTFISPWPQGSPYYYSPEHVNFAMKITSNGIYLHDATWRSVFGPGTNVPHIDPQFGPESGSHGCVNLPLSSAQWLYNWAPLGTLVQIVN